MSKSIKAQKNEVYARKSKQSERLGKGMKQRVQPGDDIQLVDGLCLVLEY